MAPPIYILQDSEFRSVLNASGSKLVIVHCTVSWRNEPITPVFAEMSVEYPNALFLVVNIDECRETATSFGLTTTRELKGYKDMKANISFMFLRNKVKIESIQGADKDTLEEIIKKHYGEDGGEGEIVTVKGMMDLVSFIDKTRSECLNEDDQHPFSHCLKTNECNYLASDCDEQLILSLAFFKTVKVHSLKMKAPEDGGPKKIKIFINQPNTLDFDQAEGMVATQELSLEMRHLKGEIIPLMFSKFQSVNNIQLFIKNNRDGGDVTKIEYLCLIGTPVETTNMQNFMRVAGKKGE